MKSDDLCGIVILTKQKNNGGGFAVKTLSAKTNVKEKRSVNRSLKPTLLPGHKKKSVVISVMSAGNIIFRSLCVHTDGGTLYCFC